MALKEEIEFRSEHLGAPRITCPPIKPRTRSILGDEKLQNYASFHHSKRDFYTLRQLPPRSRHPIRFVVHRPFDRTRLKLGLEIAKITLGRITIFTRPLFSRICRTRLFDREIKNPRARQIPPIIRSGEIPRGRKNTD